MIQMKERDQRRRKQSIGWGVYTCLHLAAYKVIKFLLLDGLQDFTHLILKKISDSHLTSSELLDQAQGYWGENQQRCHFASPVRAVSKVISRSSKYSYPRFWMSIPGARTARLHCIFPLITVAMK